MEYSAVTDLTIKNYGCIRDATFKLSPLHALIGPNDSGKSTILRGLRTVMQFAAGTFDLERNSPFDPMIDANIERLESSRLDLSFAYEDQLAYRLFAVTGGITEQVSTVAGQLLTQGETRAWNRKGVIWRDDKGSPSTILEQIRQRVSIARLLQFDPSMMRRPAPVITVDESIDFIDESGAGLVSVYQAISSRDVDAFVELRNRVRQRFPSIKNITVPNKSSSDISLLTQLVDGAVVPAKAMSEGLLYFLGYLALNYLEPRKLLLIEEPENGLHPSRIAEVVGILREISKTTQVVLATHSPLVINELNGDEVTIVTRTNEDGTRGTLLKDVPGFEDAMKVYQPGEFWLAYADGEREEALLSGGVGQ